MCVPAAAVAGASVGLGILDYDAQRRNAEAAQEFAEFNQGIATQDAMAQYEALARREMQENEAAAQALAETRRAVAQAAGTARAAAGGTAGTDVGLLFDDFAAQEARNRFAVKRNLEFKQDEFAAQRESIRLGLHSRIAANQPPPLPNIYNSILRIGIQGAGAYFGAK